MRLILLIAISLFATELLAFEHLGMSFFSARYKEKIYTVVVIAGDYVHYQGRTISLPGRHLTAFPPGAQAASQLLARLHAERFARYKEMYPDIDPRIFDEARDRSSFNDGRTEVIALFEGEFRGSLQTIATLGKTKAMLAISHTDDQLRALPSTILFGLDFPEAQSSEIKMEIYEASGNVWKPEDWPDAEWQSFLQVSPRWSMASDTGALRSMEYVGDQVELGGIFNDIDPGITYLMFEIAENHFLASRGRWIYLPLMGERLIFPKVYVTSCNRNNLLLVRFFKSLGFEELPWRPQDGFNARFRMSREQFRHLGRRKNQSRAVLDLQEELAKHGALRPLRVQGEESGPASREAALRYVERKRYGRCASKIFIENDVAVMEFE